MKHKGLVAFLSLIMFIVGGLAGVVGFSYITLPHNEELVVSNETYYSLNTNSTTLLASGVEPAEAGAVSVHFLELGNKYTGDCTYIKVGENIDILIDCGSKSNSISTVSNYLNKYVTDGSLEYVIITHAHQDHYAGFATTENVDSIFDLYECKNIIQFSQTNQKSTAKLYNNYIRERNAEIENGAILYTATQVLESFDNGIITLDEINNISLQVLNSYYYTNPAHTENDYSVCTMLNQGDKHFLFTGDLEADGEAQLVKLNNLPEKIELYKAGHHGSKTSSTMALLNKIQPKIVCVCCCAGSSEYTKTEANQFPTVEFINNISQFTTDVYVTTLSVDYKNNIFTSFNGNIVVMAKKNSTPSVYCSNNTTKLKDTDWFKTNRLELCKSFTNQPLHQSWLAG